MSLRMQALEPIRSVLPGDISLEVSLAVCSVSMKYSTTDFVGGWIGATSMLKSPLIEGVLIGSERYEITIFPGHQNIFTILQPNSSIQIGSASNLRFPINEIVLDSNGGTLIVETTDGGKTTVVLYCDTWTTKQGGTINS